MQNNKKIPVFIMDLINKSKTFTFNLNVNDDINLEQFRDFIFNNLESRTHYDILLRNKDEYLTVSGVILDARGFMFDSENREGSIEIINYLYKLIIEVILKEDSSDSLETIEISFYKVPNFFSIEYLRNIKNILIHSRGI